VNIIRHIGVVRANTQVGRRGSTDSHNSGSKGTLSNCKERSTVGSNGNGVGSSIAESNNGKHGSALC
jgi:hypothetical protein